MRLALLCAACCLAWRWLRRRRWWNQFLAEQQAKVWDAHKMGHRQRLRNKKLADLEIEQCPYCAKPSAQDGASTTAGRCE